MADLSATEGCTASKATSGPTEPSQGPTLHDGRAQSAQQPPTAVLLPAGCLWPLPHHCEGSTHIDEQKKHSEPVLPTVGSQRSTPPKTTAVLEQIMDMVKL